MQFFSALVHWVREHGDLLGRESAHPSQGGRLQDQGGMGVRTAPRPTPSCTQVSNGQPGTRRSHSLQNSLRSRLVTRVDAHPAALGTS